MHPFILYPLIRRPHHPASMGTLKETFVYGRLGGTSHPNSCCFDREQERAGPLWMGLLELHGALQMVLLRAEGITCGCRLVPAKGMDVS